MFRTKVALAEKVYIKGHAVKMTRDEGEPGSVDFTFRVDFGDLSHLAVDLKSKEDFDRSDLAAKLEQTDHVEKQLQQDLVHVLTHHLGREPKKVMVSIEPDQLDAKSIRRYGYEVSVACAAPKREALQKDIEAHLGHALDHVALDLEPAMRGQQIDRYGAKVEGSSAGSRALMKALYECVGNKRYMRDVQDLFDRIDLTPAEHDALARLAHDLQDHHAGAAKLARQKW